MERNAEARANLCWQGRHMNPNDGNWSNGRFMAYAVTGQDLIEGLMFRLHCPRMHSWSTVVAWRR